MDKTVYEDIKQALLRIKKQQNSNSMFHSHSAIYPFTTENLKGYYDKNEIEGKDILTICSSGDHLFNAMLMDANKVDCFDINVLAKYYMYLKLGAIKSLDYEDFLKFFVKRNKIYIKNSLDEKKYLKIRDFIDENTKIFWDNMLDNKRGKTLRYSLLFSDDENTKTNIIKCNNYLDKNNYYTLKGKIEKYEPKFYNINVKDLPKSLNDKYDVIYLSNIAKYINDIFSSHNLMTYRKFILEDLSKNLKENGLIFLAYIYDYVSYDDNIEWYYKIDDYKQRKNAFSSTEFETRVFKSAYDEDNYKDAVIVYKKELDKR